ncbi:MAG TPA: PEGA domain-containing protein [Vicinamibacterales bacterium]
MSLRPLEEPDPLLAFSNETAGARSSAPPLEPGLQPIAATEDRSSIQQPPESDRALAARVERLEHALAESKSQAAALKSEVATLVRAVADIRRSPIRPSVVPTKIASERFRPGTAPKIAGLIVGAALGIGGWMYLSSDTDATIAAPASDVRGPAPDAAPAADSDAPLAPSVVLAAETIDRGPAANEPPAKSIAPVQAPKVTPARDDSDRSSNVTAARYVGTLSIDADPGGEVFVNRQSAGRTPLRLTDLRAGSHLIWVEREGYRRWTRVVQVPANRVTRLSADLEPLAPR